MLELREKRETLETAPVTCTGQLTLTFDDRRKSRLRARLEDGREVAVLLPRGTSLRDGDYLCDPQANVLVRVNAAVETLSVAHAPDAPALVRAAYHLGNRHVPVQLGSDWVAYPHDHVLDGLVRSLGLTVVREARPFEPEGGGYGHGHHHD